MKPELLKVLHQKSVERKTRGSKPNRSEWWDLVRPALFIFARLGLFLAVVAWVVSHWWASVFVHNRSSAVLVPLGIVITQGQQKWTENGLTVYSLNDLSNWRDQMSHPEFNGAFYMEANPYRSTFAFIGAGVRYIGSGTASWCLSIRHWLITTIFAAFNICLHCFYRKDGRSIWLLTGLLFASLIFGRILDGPMPQPYFTLKPLTPRVQSESKIKEPQP